MEQGWMNVIDQHDVIQGLNVFYHFILCGITKNRPDV